MTAKIPIHLAALNPDALQLIERALLDKTLGHRRMFFNLEQAIEAYQVRQQEMINE